MRAREKSLHNKKHPFAHTNEREEEQHTVMEEAEDEATENTTSTTTTGTPPPPPPAMMMIPTFANARNRALDEAIAEHAEQVLKREKDACRHANRAYLMKQHQKDVGKALGRLEIHLQEYSRLKENEKERLANARLEKVRTERERKKREIAIEEEKEL